MNLINRAAWVLAESQTGSNDWGSLGPGEQKQFHDGVRAVLKSLRDPDERMAEAGAEIIRNVGAAESAAAHLNDAANTWRLMIDVLLEDER
ncbi:MAG: hypothetical protein ABIT04_09425 [Novosphingobium sp.]